MATYYITIQVENQFGETTPFKYEVEHWAEVPAKIKEVPETAPSGYTAFATNGPIVITVGTSGRTPRCGAQEPTSPSHPLIDRGLRTIRIIPPLD